MHDACLHHAQCMMCMDSLEGLLYFVKLVCTMNKTLEETLKKDLINQLLTVNFILFVQVCKEWKEMTFATTNKVFKDTEQGYIDLFDIQGILLLY